MTKAGAERNRHPLLADGERERLKTIVRVMQQVVSKTLGLPLDETRERILAGGTSVDDVVQEALLDLLRYPPEKLRVTWEALARTIGHRKAVSAVRKTTAYRRDPTSGEEISLVPFDTPTGSVDETVGRKIELIQGGADPEREFHEIHQQLLLLDLTRERLSDRDRKIFIDVYFKGRTGDDVGREIGLSGRRVRQIFGEVARRVWELALEDPLFSMLDAQLQEDEADDE